MSVLDVLYTPFPRPKRTKKNILWVLLVGLTCSGFILLYRPFNIRGEEEVWYIDLIVLGLGILFFLSVVFMEWIIPALFPKPFRKWTLGKAMIWYACLILFLGMNNFLYKNFWGGFNEFTWKEFLFVLARTLSIGATVSFFVLGVWNYVSRRKFSLLSGNEDYLITAQNGKSIRLNLKNILYISSDDNYVDIHFEAEGNRKKIVLRSSLKNIENQIVNPLSPIYRCHRRYLINIEYFKIQKMNSRSMTIGLDKYQDEVSVSKQYADFIKQRLQINP